MLHRGRATDLVRTGLGLIAVLSLAVAVSAHLHPTQCSCTKGPCVWQIINTVTSTTGPGSSATTAGAAGTPNAWANCFNSTPLGPPWPLPASASATRGDLGLQKMTGVGGWNVTYFWVDDFTQIVSVDVNGGDSLGATADSRARVDDIITGTYQQSILHVSRSVLGGASSGYVNTNVMTPTNVYQLAFGCTSRTIDLEATTQSEGESTTIGNADATGACMSSAMGGAICMCVIVQQVDAW